MQNIFIQYGIPVKKVLNIFGDKISCSRQLKDFSTHRQTNLQARCKCIYI